MSGMINHPATTTPSPPESPSEPPLGLYVHWPFCKAKCPYCDFNSHVREAVDQAIWVNAIISEIQATAARTPNRTVDTIFFGGGTPSLMLPETVDTIIQEISKQ